MTTWMKRNICEISILSVVVLIISVELHLHSYGACITFHDTDDYMRLIRIQDFFQHYDLNNHIVSRGNIPFGCDLHWTRFYDFFLIIPSYVLSFFLYSYRTAIEYVGFGITPCVQIALSIFVLKWLQDLLEEKNAFFATALLMVHPISGIICSFGRPDHHAFIVLFIIIYTCNLFSLIKANFANKRAIFCNAILASICVWNSPETLIALLVVEAVLFVAALYGRVRLVDLLIKNAVTAIGLGVVVFLFAPPNMHSIVAFSALCISCVLVLQKKSRARIIGILCCLVLIKWYGVSFDIEYDKISVVHVSLYLSSVVFFCINLLCEKKNEKDRIVYFVGSMCFIAALFLFTYPRFLLGMGADVNEYVKKIWLNRVREMQTPMTGDMANAFVVYCIIIVCATLNKAICLIKRTVPSALLWWIVIAVSTVYTILTGFAIRVWPYSVVFSLPIVFDFIMEHKPFVGLHRYIRLCIACFITIVLFLICLQDGDSEASTKKRYTEKELFTELDNLSTTPIVIMAHSNDGPEILYYTKHKVVGAPYHRQFQGIIASYQVMEDEYNKEAVRKHLLNTGTSYIFIRRPKKVKKISHTLVDMVAQGNVPEGMARVQLPEKFDNIIVLKIDKTKI